MYIPLDFHKHNENPLLFTDFLEAFNLFYDARIFTSMEESVDFKPEIVFFQGSLTIDELTYLKSQTGATICMWTGDCGYTPNSSLLAFKSVVDIYVLPHYGMKKRFESILGKRCAYIFEPIQGWRYKAPVEMTEGTVCFVGNQYHNLPGGKSRAELIDFLTNFNVDLDIRGAVLHSHGPIENKDLPDLYNSSYIVIAENNIHDIDGYFTPRNIGAMAAGSCVVMRWFPGIDIHFKDGHNCFVYKTKYELLDIIVFLKNNPDYRNSIAWKGYYHALSTYAPSNFVVGFSNVIA